MEDLFKVKKKCHHGGRHFSSLKILGEVIVFDKDCCAMVSERVYNVLLKMKGYILIEDKLAPLRKRKRGRPKKLEK